MIPKPTLFCKALIFQINRWLFLLQAEPLTRDNNSKAVFRKINEI